MRAQDTEREICSLLELLLAPADDYDTWLGAITKGRSGRADVLLRNPKMVFYYHLHSELLRGKTGRNYSGGTTGGRRNETKLYNLLLHLSNSNRKYCFGSLSLHRNGVSGRRNFALIDGEMWQQCGS